MWHRFAVLFVFVAILAHPAWAEAPYSNQAHLLKAEQLTNFRSNSDGKPMSTAGVAILEKASELGEAPQWRMVAHVCPASEEQIPEIISRINRLLSSYKKIEVAMDESQLDKINQLGLAKKPVEQLEGLKHLFKKLEGPSSQENGDDSPALGGEYNPFASVPPPAPNTWALPEKSVVIERTPSKKEVTGAQAKGIEAERSGATESEVKFDVWEHEPDPASRDNESFAKGKKVYETE